nr:tRNA pseudouridine(38/39) synthase isoform X1 [Onthophagus taurus]
MNVQIKKQNNSTINEDELINLSKEELVSKIKALTAHNFQLKSIIAKSEITKAPKRNNKPFNFAKCTFRKVLLKILYLGWDYQGYVVQEDTTNTIEHHLFEALIKTCLIKSRQESDYHRCGRTDKGVSSYGQVISINLRSKLLNNDQDNIKEELDYCTMLNRVLPCNIQCIAWSPILNEFSARFDCKSRVYKYFFFKGELDIEKMRIGSNHLLGDHDFRNFCKMDVGNGVTQFNRNITKINIDLFHKWGSNKEDYDSYVITIEGQAFLWHQIRCIMGILFLIGQNRELPEIVKELLDVDQNPRKPEYNMASEIPLNLFECNYDDENIIWNYSEISLNMVLENLKKKLTYSSIKTNMLMYMINDLEQKGFGEKKKTYFSDFLLQGIKAKNYVPVMKRQKCDSLEDKIKHYTKRKRIEINNQ